MRYGPATADQAGRSDNRLTRRLSHFSSSDNSNNGKNALYSKDHWVSIAGNIASRLASHSSNEAV